MRDREKEESPLDTTVGETECHVAFFVVLFRIHHSCVVPHSSPLIVRRMDGLFAPYGGIARTGLARDGCFFFFFFFF